MGLEFIVVRGLGLNAWGSGLSGEYVGQWVLVKGVIGDVTGLGCRCEGWY